MERLGSVIALALIALLPSFVRAESGAGPDSHRWVAEASAGLDPRAVETLFVIRGTDRQLLALRAYLRAGDSLGGRWSWTQEQLSQYANTAEGRQAAADIDAVAAVFSASNPGYSLQVNRLPRSLQEQINHWNANDSVARVAAQLMQSLQRQFERGSSSPDAGVLRSALIQWKPKSAAPLAAPGLSAHGQGRAFDFAIERDADIIAGFDAASAREQWDAAGWTRKLHAAVAKSGKPFVGPLQSPYEPWHYAYAPQGN